MPASYKKILSVLLYAFLNLYVLNAQIQSIGTAYSYNGVGILYELNRNDDCFMEINLQAELGEVLMDRTDIPGISASFTRNYILRTWKSDEGNNIRLYAGIGAIAGYANDFKRKAGPFFGIKGKAGIDCHFPRRVRISLALSPIIGCHLTYGTKYQKMEYYRNGLLNSFMPEIGICYMF